jgi:small-conductance mechanosensitive channel
VFVSQAKANYYYQNEAIDIADCYSDLLVRFILALAYAPLLPVIVPITILGYLFDYIVNKYVLLRLSCRPKLLSEKITFKMMFFVKPAIVLYGLSILFFFKNLSESTRPIGITAAAIGCSFWPIHSFLFSFLFRVSKEKTLTSRPFSEISTRFFPVFPI